MNKAVKVLLSRAINSATLHNYSPFLCPDQLVAKIEFDLEQGGFKLTQKITTSKNFVGLKRTIIDKQFIPRNSSAVILVLESPHKDEYDNIHQTIGPANGENVDNINNYIDGILDKAILKSTINTPSSKITYDLILINAVQHQCSLGFDTPLFRDAMFLYYWEKDYYRENFYQRLEYIINKYTSCIFVNCCTQGKHSDLLTNHSGSLDKSRLKNKSYFDEIGIDYSKWGLVEYTLRQCVKQTMLQVKQNNPIYNEYYYMSNPSSWSRSPNNRILRKA